MISPQLCKRRRKKSYTYNQVQSKISNSPFPLQIMLKLRLICSGTFGISLPMFRGKELPSILRSKYKPNKEARRRKPTFLQLVTPQYQIISETKLKPLRNVSSVSRNRIAVGACHVINSMWQENQRILLGQITCEDYKAIEKITWYDLQMELHLGKFVFGCLRNKLSTIT